MQIPIIFLGITVVLFLLFCAVKKDPLTGCFVLGMVIMSAIGVGISAMPMIGGH